MLFFTSITSAKTGNKTQNHFWWFWDFTKIFYFYIFCIWYYFSNNTLEFFGLFCFTIFIDGKFYDNLYVLSKLLHLHSALFIFWDMRDIPSASDFVLQSKSVSLSPLKMQSEYDFFNKYSLSSISVSFLGGCFRYPKSRSANQ